MKRVVLMLALALVIPALAMAADFDFYTTGSFSTSGTNTYTNVGTITFTGVGSALLPACQASLGFPCAPGTQVTLGSFNSAGFPVGGIDISGEGFTLNLYQTLPGSNSGSYIGSLSGVIKNNSSTGVWYLANLSATMLNLEGPSGIFTQYQLILDANPPATCCGNPCIALGLPDGTVKALVTQVPEPASMLLLGTGLSGLAGVVRRRMKK